MAETTAAQGQMSWTLARPRHCVTQHISHHTSLFYLFASSTALFLYQRRRPIKATGLYLAQVVVLFLANRDYQSHYEGQILSWHQELKNDVAFLREKLGAESDTAFTKSDIPRVRDAMLRCCTGEYLRKSNSAAIAAQAFPPYACAKSNFEEIPVASLEAARLRGKDQEVEHVLRNNIEFWRGSIDKIDALLAQPLEIRSNTSAVWQRRANLSAITLGLLILLMRKGHLNRAGNYSIRTLERLRLLPRRFAPQMPAPIPIRL